MKIKQIKEDGPTNAVGTGAIQGVDDPGLTPNQMNNYKKKNKKQARAILVRRKKID